MLVGGGVLAALTLTSVGCGSAPRSPAIDDLASQQRLARHDSELAAAAGAALTDAADAGLGRTLAEIAAERSAHARALGAEIARATGRPEPDPVEPVAPPIDTEPAVSDVVHALRTAADSAGAAAITASGYCAGLLASIAASCTAAYTVALVPQS